MAFLLLETGDALLLETGDHLLLEISGPISDALLLETGFYLLLETGDHLLLEGNSPPPIIVIPPTQGDNLGGGAGRKRKRYCEPFADKYWDANTCQPETEKLTPVDSEAISHIAHDPRKELITVKFKRMGGNDRPYQYHKVSEEKAKKILAAAKNPSKSLGEAVNKELIGKHPFSQGKAPKAPQSQAEHPAQSLHEPEQLALETDS